MSIDEINQSKIKNTAAKLNILFNKGLLSEAEMKIDEALEIYHSIKEQDPLYFDASVRIANIYFTQGKEMAAH